ncbi:hypothetical protein IW262DRAFT_1296000 [Armillaria fumosa]|nr:hypothetical protein IW262DRAFT_1296000 [Armillaria fumosa]
MMAADFCAASVQLAEMTSVLSQVAVVASSTIVMPPRYCSVAVIATVSVNTSLLTSHCDDELPLAAYTVIRNAPPQSSVRVTRDPEHTGERIIGEPDGTFALPPDVLDSLHQINTPFLGAFINEDSTESEGGKYTGDTCNKSSAIGVTRTRIGGGERGGHICRVTTAVRVVVSDLSEVVVMDGEDLVGFGGVVDAIEVVVVEGGREVEVIVSVEEVFEGRGTENVELDVDDVKTMKELVVRLAVLEKYNDSMPITTMHTVKLCMRLLLILSTGVVETKISGALEASENKGSDDTAVAVVARIFEALKRRRRRRGVFASNGDDDPPEDSMCPGSRVLPTAAITSRGLLRSFEPLRCLGVRMAGLRQGEGSDKRVTGTANGGCTEGSVIDGDSIPVVEPLQKAEKSSCGSVPASKQ